MIKLFDNDTSVIVFSVARSGTHLAMQLLSERGYKEWFPKVAQNGIGHTFNVPKKKNFVFAGHIQCTKYKKNFIESALNGIYIIRNPFDVIVSQAYYIKDKEHNHPLHNMFQDLNYEECMNVLIDGLDPMESIFEKYRENNGWMKTKNIITLKYEDLAKTSNPVKKEYLFYFRDGEDGNWKQYENVKWNKVNKLAKRMGYDNQI